MDGLTTFTMDTNTQAAVARAAGIPSLKFFSNIPFGGGAAAATVQQAAMAVATGVADVVVAYRAFNERSGNRFGQFATHLATGNPSSSGVDNAFSYTHGLGTPAAQVAMVARRYMHVYGARSEDFGRVAVADRKHAAVNPAAHFYGKPITLEEHQASRWIAEPLHLLDCCQETDGGVALVITSAERAKDLPNKPALISRRRTGFRRGPVRHDQLLPRRHERTPGNAPGRRPAVGAERAHRAGHAGGHPLRPLHPVRPHAARGTRLLRSR